MHSNQASLFTLAILTVALGAACSSDGGDGNAATGGTSASGGAGGANAGGTAGTGGGTSSGGTTSTGGSGGAGASGGSGGSNSGSGLAAKYGGLFPIGAAVADWHLTNQSAIVLEHFNHLTAENAMKAGSIHPSEDTWNTTEADRIADFARDNDMKLTGHTLVWHRQQPAWFFQGLTAADPASIETLKSRLKAHIDGMVERYADVVDNWDVVNEAISDDQSKTWRDAEGGSQWYEIFGSEEYIYWGFQYAKDALEAREPGSSAGKLYYNDYNMTQKVDRAVAMATWLRDEKGIEIDGIGLQGHWRLDWPSVSDIEATIDKIVAAGFKVKISELDLTVYNDYPAPSYSFMPAAEVMLTQQLETQQATRYKALFDLFRKKQEHITSVTTWGTSDERSWLNNEPVAGRRDYPLLWDDQHQPKDALGAILDF